MNEIEKNLEHVLSNLLQTQGYGVDLIPIPRGGDRMIRLRTLEELLDSFDSGQDGIGYLIQVKSKATAMSTESLSDADRSASSTSPEEIAKETVYLPTGELNTPFLLKNAQLLFASGEVKLARNIYQSIRETGEKVSHCQYWIGRCFEAEGNLEGARSAFEESITFDPRFESFQHLASVLIRAKRDQEAAECLERALNLKGIDDKMQFQMHLAAGNCWTRCMNSSRAETHYQVALALDPTHDGVCTNLAHLYLADGKTGEARRYFQNALALNPRSDKALTGLGNCALTAGERRDAHDFFVRSLELNSSQPQVLFQLVKLAHEIKSFAPAAARLSHYIENHPINVHLLYSLAGLQYHLGRIEEAQSTVDKILSISPDHIGAKDLLELLRRIAPSN